MSDRIDVAAFEARAKHADALIEDLRRLCHEKDATIAERGQTIGELRAEVSNLKYAAIQQERTIACARDAALEEAAFAIDYRHPIVPCGCCQQIDGEWFAKCYCGNGGDFREASDYCEAMNTRAAILALKSKEAPRD